MFRHEIPHAADGQVIGLFGGSFDPIHEGHILLSKKALRRLGLDEIWWLFSPQNPLKTRSPAPMNKRIEFARQQFQHPKLVYSDLEARLNSRFTAATIARLQALYPRVNFIWIMGADNLAQISKWQDWQEIFQRVPVAVFARPGEQIRAGSSKAAQIMEKYRLPPSAARTLATHSLPAWVMIGGATIDRSSSQIRASGDW